VEYQVNEEYGVTEVKIAVAVGTGAAVLPEGQKPDIVKAVSPNVCDLYRTAPGGKDASLKEFSQLSYERFLLAGRIMYIGLFA
jgi:hypothetical protein